MDEYTKKLLIEFLYSKGITFSSIDYQELMDLYEKYFLEWLKERKKIRKKYISFLNNMKLNIKDRDCAELYKGVIDSIGLSFDSTIISPFIDKNDNSRIINSSLILYDNDPLFIKNGKTDIELKNNFINNINVIYTQNPYEFTLLKGISALTKYNKDIVVGVYGNINDYDAYLKKNEIIKLAQQFDYDYKFDCIKDNDYYYCAIGTTKNIKKRSR